MNKSALTAILTEFGNRLGQELGDSCPQDTFQVALDTCLQELPVQKAKSISTPRGPSKASLKLANRLAELIELGGDEPEEGYGLKELNDSIRSLKKTQQAGAKAEAKALKTAAKQQAKEHKKAAKSAKKAASPKSNTFDRRFPSNSECDDFKGANGSYLRVTIDRDTRKVTKKNLDNWTEEAIERFTVQYPNDIDTVKKEDVTSKKSKKIVKVSAEEALDKEQIALIAAMTTDAVTKKIKKIKKKISLPIEKPVEEQVEELEELEEEELEQVEELEEEELEEEELEDEPEFPGEDEIESFEHACLNVYEEIDFYADEDNNVWDEDKQFVGKYDPENDALVLSNDYAPQEQ